MDWLVLFWALFVSAVYIGGYLFPSIIGVYTPNLAVVYAVVLIGAVCSFVLRLRSAQTSEAGNKEPSVSRQTSKKR